MARDTDNSTSTEVARIPERAVTIMDHLGIRLTDPQEVSWRIAERLVTAQSLEALLDDTGPLGLRQHLGESFTIRNVEWLPGTFEDGPGFYALINAVNADGEPVTYTSGAMSVMMQLARGVQQGWFDGVALMAQQSDTPTANGFRPYRLVKA